MLKIAAEQERIRNELLRIEAEQAALEAKEEEEEQQRLVREAEEKTRAAKAAAEAQEHAVSEYSRSWIRYFKLCSSEYTP